MSDILGAPDSAYFGLFLSMSEIRILIANNKICYAG